MNTAKVYKNTDGKDRTIWQMVREEPDWAANRIQAGEDAIAELAAAKDRLAEIENAAELPTPALDVVICVSSSGKMEYAQSYDKLRNHALHLAAENERMREALSLCVSCVKASTEYRQGNPAFEQAESEAIDAARKGKA